MFFNVFAMVADIIPPNILYIIVGVLGVITGYIFTSRVNAYELLYKKLTNGRR